MKRTLGVPLWIILGFGLLSCASVPKESVELSVTAGRDLAEVHRAHRQVVLQYFHRIEGDINAFVDEVYRPYAINGLIEEFELLDRIQDPGPDLDALDILEIFVDELSAEIEDFRDSLLTPVQRQRDSVLQAVDASYMRIQNAQAIVTGHLASVRKVRDAQSEFLNLAGMGTIGDAFISRTTALSDRIQELTAQGRKAEGKLDQIEGLINQFRGTITGQPSPPGVPLPLESGAGAEPDNSDPQEGENPSEGSENQNGEDHG